MNPKGDLIAFAAAQHLDEPDFQVTQDGPAHAPNFVCTVRLGTLEARGEGRTKRDAEREAARAALLALHGQSAPHPGLPARPWPLYAELLSQALIVAHERTPDEASLGEVRRRAVTLYAGLLSDLGILEE